MIIIFKVILQIKIHLNLLIHLFKLVIQFIKVIIQSQIHIISFNLDYFNSIIYLIVL
jgi:hypothetical protein